MKSKRPINDICQCLHQAQHIAKRIKQPRQKEQSYIHIFRSLAGDELVGLMAFAIWRGRSQIQTCDEMAPVGGTAGARASRASHAPTCWHEERAAFGDLPQRRRSIR